MMYGLVAKDIPRKMWGSVDGAQDAVDKEWRRLREQDVWDENNPEVCGTSSKRQKAQQADPHWKAI